MKLIHLSDLHLGKRLFEFSLLEDQQFILSQILEVIDGERPDGVIIAGDVYDKSIPSTEAVQLFDDFLVRLAGRGLKVFVISGNHDSPERIAFGARLMDQSGVYLSPVYDGTLTPITLTDAHGPVHLYLLPFVKPSHVRRYYPEAGIGSYTDALCAALCGIPADPDARNLLITHQFVTGASRCDSEELSVGGTDNVEASLFDAFDYVALGHLHNPQQVHRETIRYCGSPLKYSFSESNITKSVTVISLAAKQEVSIRTVPLTPMRELRELRGSYEELTRRSYYQGTTYQEDYLHITLTDEDDIPDAIGKLRAIYHNIMKLDYDNRRTRSRSDVLGAQDAEEKTPLDLFAEFYLLQNNQPMTEQQQAYVADLIAEIWGADA